MRMLHDRHPAEQVICQGAYEYRTNGASTGHVEHWQATRLPSGAEVLRVDLDGRQSANGASLLAHLKRNPDGQPAWLRLHFEQGDQRAAAQYNFEGAEVHITRQAVGELRSQETLDIAEGYQIDFHPVIAHDFPWRGYPMHARGKRWSMAVFSPDLWLDTPQVMSGRALRYDIKPGEPETCETPAGVFEATRVFEVTLSDGVTATGWYDEFGIPLRWFYPQKDYDFVLVSYERN
ncbi:MAG: hypothetical protein IT326_06715 [Anaerolineae bacterium]|nr:hypothetical protein [Anaerolineae bacterium]